jgi:transcriptional regulator with XRE-family HTH domain
MVRQVQKKEKTNNEMNVRFGERLQSLRKEQGLSLRELADKCSLDNSNISKIEQGKFDIRLSTVIELAKALGKHPRELLDYDFD